MMAIIPLVIGTATVIPDIVPGVAGLLVPIDSLGFGFGFGFGLQLVPSALGMLHFRFITEKGAFFSLIRGAFFGLITGASLMVVMAIFKPDVPFGPGFAGFVVNILIALIVSRFTALVSVESLHNYHDMFDEYMRDNTSTNSQSLTQLNTEGKS